MCFDEWGPLELKPFGGVSWARQRLARRMRATYRRLKGTEQFFGFYDVHADCLSGKFYKRKRLIELFDAFQRLRKCYPNKRLFVMESGGATRGYIHTRPPRKLQAARGGDETRHHR